MTIKELLKRIARGEKWKPLDTNDVHPAALRLTAAELNDPEYMLHYVSELWMMIDEIAAQSTREQG